MTGETVVLLVPGEPTVDRGGNEVPGPDRRVKGFDCLVAPRSYGDVTGQGRQGVIVGFTVYMPGRPPIDALDRIEVRGVAHEVVGEPGVWFDPDAGGNIGVEVATRRVEG